MGVRKVTLTIQSSCGTAGVHQPFFIQLSTDETWIPPQPLSYPPPGQRDTTVDAVAKDVHAAMNNAAQQRGSGIAHVGPVTDPGAGKKGTRRQIEFWAKNEVNIGITKAKGPGEPQIEADVDVEPGEGNFKIKIIFQAVLWAEGKRRKKRGGAGGSSQADRPWKGKKPSEVGHKTLKLKEGQGGFGSTSCKKKITERRKMSVTLAPTRESTSCELPPTAGGDLGGWSGGAPSSVYAFVATPTELAPVHGGLPDNERLFSTGFYYPVEHLDPQDGDLLSLGVMGLTAGPRAIRRQEELDTLALGIAHELSTLTPVNPFASVEGPMWDLAPMRPHGRRRGERFEDSLLEAGQMAPPHSGEGGQVSELRLSNMGPVGLVDAELRQDDVSVHGGAHRLERRR